MKTKATFGLGIALVVVAFVLNTTSAKDYRFILTASIFLSCLSGILFGIHVRTSKNAWRWALIPGLLAAYCLIDGILRLSFGQRLLD
jgi:hypothetical protein